MPRFLIAFPLMLAAAGCGETPADNVTVAGNASTVDINSAADEAQGDIDTYAANSLENQPAAVPLPPAASPTPSAEPSLLTPPAPGTPGGLPDDRTPISEAPYTPESAQGAANVVQTYYALIGEGKYRQAWALWGNRGAASGMSADAFAASFAKYSDYHANVGAPGRVDAGAGQRYVSVPVQVYGRLAESNRPFAMLGEVTLHRVADIDGATAEQRSWRITNANVKTRPAAAHASAQSTGTDPAHAPRTSPAPAKPTLVSQVDYRCDDEVTFHGAFYAKPDTLVLSRDGKALATLVQQRAGSGIWYKGEGWELRGKARQDTITAPGQDPVSCTAT